MGLEFVPTEQILEEFKKRFDAYVLLTNEDINGEKGGITNWYFHGGFHLCVGLLAVAFDDFKESAKRPMTYSDSMGYEFTINEDNDNGEEED